MSASSKEQASAERLRENPFYVLGVATDASRTDVERAGQKLLAELSLGRAGAATYASPLGPQARTEARVRTALAELRDPAKRLVHEVWAQVPVRDDVPAGDVDLAWTCAERLLGVRRR